MKNIFNARDTERTGQMTCVSISDYVATSANYYNKVDLSLSYTHHSRKHLFLFLKCNHNIM